MTWLPYDLAPGKETQQLRPCQPEHFSLFLFLLDINKLTSEISLAFMVMVVS
jgi:hypothetical protein